MPYQEARGPGPWGGAQQVGGGHRKKDSPQSQLFGCESGTGWGVTVTKGTAGAGPCHNDVGGAWTRPWGWGVGLPCREHILNKD